MSGRLGRKPQAQHPLGRIGDQKALTQQFADQLLAGARRGANDCPELFIERTSWATDFCVMGCRRPRRRSALRMSTSAVPANPPSPSSGRNGSMSDGWSKSLPLGFLRILCRSCCRSMNTVKHTFATTFDILPAIQPPPVPIILPIANRPSPQVPSPCRAEATRRRVSSPNFSISVFQLFSILLSPSPFCFLLSQFLLCPLARPSPPNAMDPGGQRM